MYVYVLTHNIDILCAIDPVPSLWQGGGQMDPSIYKFPHTYMYMSQHTTSTYFVPSTLYILCDQVMYMHVCVCVYIYIIFVMKKSMILLRSFYAPFTNDVTITIIAFTNPNTFIVKEAKCYNRRWRQVCHEKKNWRHGGSATHSAVRWPTVLQDVSGVMDMEK